MDRSRRAAGIGALSRVGIASSIQPWPIPAIVANLSPVMQLMIRPRSAPAALLGANKPQLVVVCKLKYQPARAA